MFEDNKQHVLFLLSKSSKACHSNFCKCNYQPEINGNLYILNLGSSSMFSECHEICLLQHCFKTYTPFIQWTIKFKHLTFDGTTVMLDVKQGHFVEGLDTVILYYTDYTSTSGQQQTLSNCTSW